MNTAPTQKKISPLPLERLLPHLIGLSLILRLVLLGFGELLPEEAYYWQFSRHLDWSYLDHPPMVAWLIRAGTSVFGQNEFGVRIGGFVCSLGTLLFIFKLTKELFDTRSAQVACLLASLLPYFFLNGFLVTPDAPLVLAWSAMLYFLVRALRLGGSLPWIAVGASFGIGMISKYTIALNAASAFIFLILHPPARKWFTSPLPYVAGGIALLFFTPVLYWNWAHDWASFAFQTSRRLNEQREFGLPIFLGSLFCIVAPSGVLATWECVRRPHVISDDRFVRRFCCIFLLVPALLFFAFSLTHEPKINWVGPAFVVFLPALAHYALNSADSATGRLANRLWLPTLSALLLIYTIVLAYLCVGIPGIAYSPKSQRYVGWRDLGRQVAAEAIKQEQAGDAPVIVGMDKHFVGSELAFYTRLASSQAPLPASRFAGRAIFGMNALMWERWIPPDLDGKNLLLVAKSRDDLEKPELARFTSDLGPITEMETRTRGSVSGRFYMRTAKSYRAASSQQQE